ncbi:efflux RND transporter periplasmic adaptor subunit [Paracoccus liaowanqingii]|uniref:Efflux RND transporter periplasmic adaptor subunit n=1 Tax=Paracoccus liaowanqingii TaxID=2560053 RepID=A0A4Z1BI05_9RHOB|nr:efflux RND transporter periplasmic adaptor subunit [Paracoccus liaowanqingii]TGN50448.1 efflux RND transporter periplasmic adaptor subunit [Paracoccus liaowanqingii]
MRRIAWIVTAGLVTVGAGTAAVVTSSRPDAAIVATDDPRLQPPVVTVVQARPVAGTTRSYTGIVAARVQSQLGFRVSGKVIERLVDVGQEVRSGQPLMRIDDTDLQLALTARRNAVDAARAVLVQAEADELRYAGSVQGGWAPEQRYEQAKAARDTARAQLAAVEAEAEVAANAATYSTLVADRDGTIVSVAAEPGQVVATGQTVVTLAESGPREAVVSLPETIRPALGAPAEAVLYGRDDQVFAARLRQLSDAADPISRTFEARFVLEGDAAQAPLGATVVIRISDTPATTQVKVPLGAILDNGQATGVWILAQDDTAVAFQPVTLTRMSGEMAVISGIDVGQDVVAMGAHMLSAGAEVRVAGAEAAQ